MPSEPAMILRVDALSHGCPPRNCDQGSAKQSFREPLQGDTSDPSDMVSVRVILPLSIPAEAQARCNCLKNEDLWQKWPILGVMKKSSMIARDFYFSIDIRSETLIFPNEFSELLETQCGRCFGFDSSLTHPSIYHHLQRGFFYGKSNVKEPARCASGREV